MIFLTNSKIEEIVEAASKICFHYMEIEQKPNPGFHIAVTNMHGNSFIVDRSFNYEKWQGIKTYDKYAGDKAQLAYYYRTSTLSLTQNPVQYLNPGEIIFPGGDFLPIGHNKNYGIGVGVSGFKGVRDHAIARTIINMMEAEARVSFSTFTTTYELAAYTDI